MSGSQARANVRGIVIGALTAATLAACASGGGQQAQQGAPAKPQQVLSAPKGLLAAAQPQPDGTVWTLAGNALSKGLFDISLATGKGAGSISVSSAARSVTESLSGTVGLGLGTGRSGALELLHGSTGKVIRTVPLGAPARDVAVGADGAAFYVLNGNARSASVTVVNSGSGDVQGTIPVPLNTVSIAPDAQGSTVYALQPSGTVSQIAVTAGKIMTRFTAGPGGRSLALSPDGSTLYVLKDVAGTTANVAEVNLATDSVQRVVPAPAHCLQVLVSADGTRLYQLVGTPAYGNIQVFAS